MNDLVLENLDLTLLVVNFVVAVLLPAVVAFVTKQVASSQVKALVLLVLSAVSAGLTTALAAPDGFSWQTAAVSFATVFYLSVGNHFGILKPAGITGADGSIQTKTATVGIG